MSLNTESCERMHSEIIFFFLTNIFLYRQARLAVKAKKCVMSEKKKGIKKEKERAEKWADECEKKKK